MRLKILAIGISLVIISCAVIPQNSYAGSSTKIRLYARRGSDDDGHRGRGRHHSNYRYYRHYPSDFYFHKKIYYYPSRRNYYYYDFFPEKIYYYEWEKQIVPNNPDYLPITSIANMGSQGVPDAVIIAEIERTRSTYKLNSEVITYLQQNNVSDRVIDYMIGTSKSY